MLRTITSATLLLCAAIGVAAEPPAPAPAITPVPAAAATPRVVAGTQPIRFSGPDLAQVAKVRFFASNNQGATWTLAGEQTVDAANPVAPQLDFKSPSDGTWAFVTTAVLRDGRTEPEPVAGKLPLNALITVVDNTPPQITDVQATIDTAGPTSVTVGVTWTGVDANPAGASVEVSGDGGRTFVAAPSSGLSGYVKLTVPRSVEAEAVLVKVTIRDLAGNSASSDPKRIPLPKDPEQNLASAVAALPTAAEIIPLERPEAVADVPAVAGSAASASAATGASVAPAPNTPATPAAAPARANAVPSSLAPSPFVKVPRAPGALPAAAFLRGQAAADVFADARALAANNETAPALERYMLLRNSEVAAEAAGEELLLRNLSGDSAGAIAAYGELDPELRTDVVRLEAARARLVLGAPDEAIQILGRLPRSSPRFREGMLLVGVAREGQGRRGEATKIYEHLAAGDDAVAAEAKARNGK